MTTTLPFTIHTLIEIALEARAADVFVKSGQVPMMKRFGEITAMDDSFPVLDDSTIEELLRPLMSEKQLQEFLIKKDYDIGFTVPGKCRVRCNLYHQKGTWASVMRIVPIEIKSVEDLGLPPIVNEVTKHKQGLVLVTGPTGSGKTTTLAAMLDLINRNRKGHIVTLEDPLEFLHQDKGCYVSQRELHLDTSEFQMAIRAALREAPDIILIGEMRDAETMGIALQAGETGHLVFSTVHTASAYETMDRVVNMFPPHEKAYLAKRLAGSLKSVLSQKLVPRSDSNGRVCAMEVLICTPTVSKTIEDGHFSDIYHHMNEGSFWGMQTMNQSLYRFVKAGLISEEQAMLNAGIQSELRQMLRR